MPVELIEEVWQDMCSVYQSKASVDKNNIQSHSKKHEIIEDDLKIEIDQRNTLKNKVYNSKELEEIFLNWENEAENNITNLVSYGKWLISKNYLDKVSLLIKTIRRIIKYFPNYSKQWINIEQLFYTSIQEYSYQKYGCFILLD